MAMDDELLVWAREELSNRDITRVDQILSVCRKMQDRKQTWINDMNKRLEIMKR